MKKLFVAAAIAAACTLPSMAMAADDPAMMATMVCRAPAASEKPNAMMGKSELVCRKIDMAKIHAAMAKMMTPGMTSAEMQAQADILKDSYLIAKGMYAQ